MDPRLQGARCDECPLQAGKLVRPAIPKNPNGLVIIGDMPAYEDAKAGTVGNGQAGSITDGALVSAGTKKAETHITNLVLCFPDTRHGNDLTKIMGDIKRAHKLGMKTYNEATKKIGITVKEYNRVLRDRKRQQKKEADNFTKAHKAWIKRCTAIRKKHEKDMFAVVLRNIRVNDETDILPMPPDPIYPVEPKPRKATLEELETEKIEKNVSDGTAAIEAVKKPKLITPMDCCRPRLLKEIEGAKSIVVTGKVGSKELVGLKTKLTDEYGFPRKILGRPGCVTMHPSTLGGKMGHYHGAFNLWVARALRMAKDGIPKWKNHDMFYSPYKVNLLLRDLLKNAEKSANPITVAIDVETSGLDPVCDELRCAALTFGEVTVIIPFKSVEDARTLTNKESLILFRRVLQSPNIRKLFHNGIFDQAVLESQVGPVALPVGDTMMAHHAVESEVPHSLSFLSSILLDGPSWKSLGDGSHGLTVQEDKKLWYYNGIDTHRTLECDKVLSPIVEADGVMEVHKVDLELQNILARMFARGLYLSHKRRLKIQARLETNGDRCFAEAIKSLEDAGAYSDPDFLSALDGEEFRPSVPRHKIAAVTYLGMMPHLPATQKTGILSTKADDLARALPFCSDAARDFVGKKLDASTNGSGLIGYQSSAKAISTFCRGVVTQDGRIRSSWRQHGTPTGRLSSRNPNFQNIPEWMREMYEAPPGYMYVGADYSALELWVNAIHSGCKNLLKALHSKDVHRANAEALFNMNFAEVALSAATKGCPVHGPMDRSKVTLDDHGKKFTATWHGVSCEDCIQVAKESFDNRSLKLTDLRKQGKTYVYAKNYRASDTTIWMRCLIEFPKMQLSEVVAMGAQWDKINPELSRKANENYQLFIRRRLKESIGYLESPILGRKRYWTNKIFSPTDAANFPIQSAGADIVNLAAIRMEPYVRAMKSFLVAQIHDAFLWEVPVRFVEPFKEMVRNEMPGKYKFKDTDGVWSFPAEVKDGKTWAEV